MLATNKRAFFDYEILETLEAGLVLSGPEVKAAKLAHISLKGTYITFRGQEACITNMDISRYKPAGPMPDYEPTRSRKILLRKRQIAYLREKSLEKGLTIIPLEVYTKGHLIKVKIGLGRGKKQYDKRETIKKRDIQKEIRRTLKNPKF